MKALLAILALALLSPAFADPANPPQLNLNYSPGDLSWTPMAIAALLVGFGFAALAYMAGEVFGMATIRAWVKAELYENALSAFLILIAIAALITFNIIVSGFMSVPSAGPGPAACPGESRVAAFDDPALYPVFAQAQYFLGCKPNPGSFLPTGTFEGWMLPPLLGAYKFLIILELALGVFSTMGFSFQIPLAFVTIPRFSLQPMVGMTIVSEAHILVLDYIAMGAAAIFAQKVLLQFIQESVLFVFLPLGILFRAIPLTRKTGSTIVAVCLAAYFIYPLSILINAQIYQNVAPINFAQYRDVVEICKELPNEGPAAYEARVEQQVAAMQDAFQEVADENQYRPSITNPIDPASPSRPWNFLDRFTAASGHFESTTWDKIKLALVSVWQFKGFILDPNAWSQYFYAFIIDEITPTMQALVLNILFLINSIILTVTFFRDISTALGGESRLFGVSKLI